ncbi:MAG: hypothetical protein ACYC09_06590 [Bacteroidota bacterium]
MENIFTQRKNPRGSSAGLTPEFPQENSRVLPVLSRRNRKTPLAKNLPASVPAAEKGTMK